jgi:hypothetical protein
MKRIEQARMARTVTRQWKGGCAGHSARVHRAHATAFEMSLTEPEKGGRCSSCDEPGATRLAGAR